MIIVGLILSLVGITSLCWLLFTLAVYALPFFVGMSVGLAAYHSGVGAIGVILLGFVGSTTTLVVAQLAFAVVKSPILRGAIALPFAASAAIAGYHAILGLAHISMPSHTWCTICAVIGAVSIGGTAFVRMAAMVASPVARRATVARS
jgi:hypothetical protein